MYSIIYFRFSFILSVSDDVPLQIKQNTLEAQNEGAAVE